DSDEQLIVCKRLSRDFVNQSGKEGLPTSLPKWLETRASGALQCYQGPWKRLQNGSLDTPLLISADAALQSAKMPYPSL
ncbi:MAG: hypothetical protein ACJ8D1_16165, partial [Microvirga sp.]